MISGLDLLDGKKPTVETQDSNISPFDIKLKEGEDPNKVAQAIVDTGSVKSGMELLESSAPEKPAILPTKIEESSKPFVDYINNPPMFMAAPMATFVPDSSTVKRPEVTEQNNEGIELALSQIWGAAKNPFDITLGTVETLSSFGSFAKSLPVAAFDFARAIGKGANFLQAYEAGAKGMEEVSENWKVTTTDPLMRIISAPRNLQDLVTEKITGKKVERESYSRIVGDVAMSPLTAVTKAVHEVANVKWLDEYPNVRGLMLIGGDVAGLMTLGALYKGGSAELAKDIRPIIEKAEKISKQEKVIEGIPDEVLKKANETILAVEKNQLELAAKALKEKVDHKKVVEEDLKAKGKEIEDIKEGKETSLISEEESSMLESLGYEKEEIAQMKPEEARKILEVDELKDGETVESLNELKQNEPAKSGVELLNEAIDNLSSDIKVNKRKGKRGEKTNSGPLTVYHRTANKNIKEVDFDAFYGTKEFSDAYKEDFGPYEHKLVIPSEVANKIIDLNKDNSTVRKLMADVVKKAYPNDSNINTIIKDIMEGKDKEAFYQEWTNKELVLPILKENGFLGATFQGEYLLSKEAIKTSRKIDAKRPITDLDLQTGTALPKKLSAENHPFRDKQVEHTNEMRKLLQEKVNNVEATPETFTQYLINEVNRYLNGEEVPIDKVRNGLSELATRADNLKMQFENPQDFNVWRGTVKEAARWARESERPKGDITLNMGVNPAKLAELTFAAYAKAKGYLEKVVGDYAYTRSRSPKSPQIKMMGAKNGNVQILEEGKIIEIPFQESDRLIDKRTGGTQLNMMIPINELPNRLKELLKTLKIVDGGKEGIFRNKEIFDKTGFWLGKDGKWRYEIDSSRFKEETYLNSTGDPNSVNYRMFLDVDEVVSNSELFKAVPEAKKIKIRVNKNLDSSGVYNPEERSIIIREFNEDTIEHELQHAVNDIVGSKFKGSNPFQEQTAINERLLTKLLAAAKSEEVREIVSIAIEKYRKYEGRAPLEQFVTGIDKLTNPQEANLLGKILEEARREEAFKNYMKDPGEMEARLASKRMDMAAEERKAKPPWETLDEMLIDEGFGDKASYRGKDKYGGEVYNLSSSVGLKLYSGIDPTLIPEATKKIIAGAKALAAYTAKARGMKEWKPTEALARAKEEFIRSGVDRSGNIRRELLDQLGNEGYEIIQKMYLSKGASSLAAQQLKQMRKEVYDGLSKNEKRILDNLILADRMLDIGKYKTTSQFKFPEGLSPTEAAAYNELFQFTEKITPEKADLLRQRAQAYFEWMKKPLKDMLDAELITEAEYDALASHNYRRLKLVDVFDKRYTSKLGKTKRTVYDSGVEALSHGRETDVFEPSSEVMALEVFNRAYGRILNNAANKTLLNLAREKKDNPFVAVKDKPTDHIPSGWDRVFVYEKGERKAIYLSPTMAKEWITNSPEMSYKMSQIIRYASGSPVLRTFATGIDWGFALANLPRDIMHIWYASRVFENGKWKPLYNSNLPVYGAQIGADIGGVFHDAIARKGRYQDYIKEGGGMEFLVHQGRLMQRGRHIEGGLDKVQDFLGYFGETSEILTRLAVRDRVIKRRAAEQGISYEEAAKDKKITQEATFAARDYMDFGQGGGVAKALDNGIPYLNASIQGTRGIFRSFKDNPIQSSYKLAQFAALVTGLYIANQSINPKTMEALKGSIDMQGNLVLPIGDGFGFDDEKGQRRYPYIKIPLDPGQKFFKMFFEASYDKATGQQVDAAGVANSLSQISPVAISSLPPTLSGTLGYTYNKDFWLNDEIWKKTDKPLGWPQSKEEYIPGKTPQAFIDVGAVTGLSPERLKYTMSELVTGGSMWSWLAGQGYDAAFGSLPKEKKEMHLAEVLSKTPISKRFIGITNPYSQYAEPINEAKEQSMLKRWIENRRLDQRVESYLYEGGKRADVIEYINKTAKDQITMERLRDRFIFSEKIKSLPNRSFWLSLKGITDIEARAKVFVERFDSASSADQEQINKEIGIVINAGGVISDEFKQQVMRVRDAKAKEK
jgi:hypothetical protein